MEPIFAGFIAFLAIGETLSPLQIAGGTLVVIAITILQIQREQTDMTPEAIRKNMTLTAIEVRAGRNDAEP